MAHVHCQHFILHRLPDGKLQGVSLRTKPDVYYSAAWELTPNEAALLIGGWFYGHQTKADPSHFGGIVLACHEAGLDNAGKMRWTLLIKARREGRGQTWRGLCDRNAKQGRMVEASLPHECETGEALA